MVIETLAGSALGGLFRLAPEALKLFDRKGERAHELSLLQTEMEFAKLKGESAIREADSRITIQEFDSIAEALKEQGETARAAGKWVSALSALVRPLVTYWFTILYSAVKIAAIATGVAAGADWKDVITTSWNEEDMAVFSMILTFWFVGRCYDRKHK